MTILILIYILCIFYNNKTKLIRIIINMDLNCKKITFHNYEVNEDENEICNSTDCDEKCEITSSDDQIETKDNTIVVN